MTDREQERQFRWGRLRTFMDEQDLAGLVIFGSDRSDRYDAGQYLFSDRRYQHFVVPRDGAATMISFAAQVAAQHMINEERGYASWIEDIREGKATELVPALLAEKGLDHARVGVIGTGFGSPFAPYGWVPKPLWEPIVERTPHARFVDVTAEFGLLMAQRSEQDLAYLAQAAQAGDLAIDRLREIAKPGVSERELYAEAYTTMLRAGMRVTWMLMQSGLDNFSWGEPAWLIRPEKPRQLAANDILGFEMFPTYAEMNTHVNGSILIGETPAETLRCAAIAREAYEVGVAELRVGRTFAEVSEAMDKPLADAGAWHVTPHLAALNPLLAGGASGLDIAENIPGFAERYPHVTGHQVLFDFEIKEGMAFSFQPDARLGRHWATVGGVVVATADGCRELNAVSPHIQHI